MKYNFVDKAKNLTPDDIKAQMNFDNVVKGASIWAGFKLGSVLLKLGSKATTAIVAGTSTVVVTAAVVVGTSTDLFKSGDVATQLPPTEIEYHPEDDMIPPMNNGVDKDSSTTAAKTTSAPIKKAATTPIKPAVKPLPQSTAAPSAIVYADVKVEAMPLPDMVAFEKFIDNELVYPVALKEGGTERVEGYVDVFWTINRKGEAINFKVRKSLGEAFDNEAIRVLKKYQNWAPASFNGDAVESNLSFRVYFKVK